MTDAGLLNVLSDAAKGRKRGFLTLATFATMLVVAALVAVMAFAFGRGGAADYAEERQERALDEVVSSVGDSAGGYSVITDAVMRVGDSVDGQFWLLESGGTILFVRDAETSNSYRGLPVGDYPGADALQTLIDSTRHGETSHATVWVNGLEYLAGATTFTFSGADYGLCVLTPASGVQGSMGAAANSALYVLLAVVLLLLVAVPTLLAARFEGLLPPFRASDADGFAFEPVRGEGLGHVVGPEPEFDPGPADAGFASGLKPVGCALPATAPADDAMPVPDPAPAGDAAFASELISEPVLNSESALEPGPAPEPELAHRVSADLIALRPESELTVHLQRLIDECVEGANLVKVQCKDSEAMQRVLRRLGVYAAGSDAHCFDLGGNAIAIELYCIDENDARTALESCFEGDGEVTAFVPITAN